jgi:hypothetical protein
MQEAYLMTLNIHIFIILLLVLSYLYMYYLISFSNTSTIYIIKKFKSILPFVYMNISILAFSGISITIISANMKNFSMNIAFVYMLITIIFLLVSSIKIFKKLKPINKVSYKLQCDFLIFSKKVLFINLIILFFGFFITKY